jgi:hypothetical protein
MHHRKLALQAHIDVALAAEIDDQRGDPQPDCPDRSGRQVMLVLELDAGIDRRMIDDAAGEGLVGVDAEIVVAAEAVGDLRKIRFRS